MGRFLSKISPARFAYFLKNAPLAVMSSALPGLVNYVVIIYLTVKIGPEAAGSFRLYLSIFALLGILSFIESAKVFMRAATRDDTDAMGLVFRHRCIVSILGLALGAALYAAARAGGQDWFTMNHLLIGLCAAIYYPADLYIAMCQARRRFTSLVAMEGLKYGGGLASVIVAIEAGATGIEIVLGYVAILTFANVVFFAWAARGLGVFTPSRQDLRRVLTSPSTKESRMLSFSSALPNALDHLDKFIVAAFFSTEVLGIYTLGYSTGRLIYSFLKPAIFIYYRRFVDHLPTLPQILLVIGIMTVAGLGLGCAFWIGVTWLEPMAIFKDALWVAMIVFASYGLAMGNSVFSQSVMINTEANSVHTFYANLVGALLCLAVYASAVTVEAAVAILVLACQFPVRHGASLTTLLLLSARQRRATSGEPAPGKPAAGEAAADHAG